MFQSKNVEKRNPGRFSILDNKVRIQNLNGQSSVLFEDISSITWVKRVTPNLLVLTIGFTLLFITPWLLTMTANNNSEENGISALAIFLIIVSLGLIVYGILNKISWDDVIIETRGGALLSYSVDEGKGSNEVDHIENAKHNATII